MSEYDEPPDPTDEEIESEATEQSVAANKSVQIVGLTVADVDATIRSLLRHEWRLQERLQEQFDQKVEELVSSLVSEVSRERVAAAVDAAIAEGFAEYDRYSGRETSRVTLRKLVDSALNFKSDDYHFRGQSIGQMAVTKAVTDIFAGELKPVLEQLKTDLRAQADGVFQAKIVASMKEALGLK